MTVQNICLEIEQSYSNVAGSFSVPVSKVAVGLLSEIGVNVVEPEMPHDAVLKIVMVGQALGAHYSDKFYFYSGAQLDGTVSFFLNGKDPVTYPLGGN